MTVTSRPTAALDGRRLAAARAWEAKAHELIEGDVSPDVARLGGLCQQVPDHVADVLFRADEMLVAMEQRRLLAVVVAA